MITVVSGLPRTGTSMMMQILHKGGMDVLTDNLRKPDDNNQKGYYELEKVKYLEKDNSWMHEAENKAVKIIAQLLFFLPSQYEYQIVFMEREIKEVMASQEKMLKNLGREDALDVDADKLANMFSQQIVKVKQWLSEQSNIRTLFVPFSGLFENPDEQMNRIGKFLNQDLDLEAMRNVIKPSLYRSRVS